MSRQAESRSMHLPPIEIGDLLIPYSPQEQNSATSVRSSLSPALIGLILKTLFCTETLKDLALMSRPH